MSADTENMLAKLQIALSQQANQGPSLYGLQAQQDPNQTAALLKHLQDQAYVNQQGNGGGDWADQFGQAGKKDFARMGQGVSSLLGIGQPQQYDNSATMAQRAAIQGGKGQLQDLLAGGSDANAAQLQVLSKLAQAGVPGAAEALSKANDDAVKLATEQSTQKKNNAQGNAAEDEIQNRAQQRDLAERQFANTQSKDTYKVVASTSTHQILENGLGDRKSIELNPSANAPPSEGQLANEATVAKLMAEGKIPLPSARQLTTPAGQRLLTAATAINPNLSTADNKTLTENAHAFSPNGVQGKAISSFNVALNHGAELESIVNGLSNGDVQAVNKAKNLFGDKFGNSTGPVAMQLAAHLYGDEVEKTIIQTGGTADERAAIKDVFSNVRTPDQLSIAVTTANKLLVGKVQNSRQIYGVSGLPGSFEEKYLGPRAKELVAKDPDYQSQFNQQATPPAAAPLTNAQGWALHTDAKGNKAYVSPDGKQFTEVK